MKKNNKMSLIVAIIGIATLSLSIGVGVSLTTDRTDNINDEHSIARNQLGEDKAIDNGNNEPFVNSLALETPKAEEPQQDVSEPTELVVEEEKVELTFEEELEQLKTYLNSLVEKTKVKTGGYIKTNALQLALPLSNRVAFALADGTLEHSDPIVHEVSVQVYNAEIANLVISLANFINEPLHKYEISGMRHGLYKKLKQTYPEGEGVPKFMVGIKQTLEANTNYSETDVAYLWLSAKRDRVVKTISRGTTKSNFDPRASVEEINATVKDLEEELQLASNVPGMQGWVGEMRQVVPIAQAMVKMKPQFDRLDGHFYGEIKTLRDNARYTRHFAREDYWHAEYDVSELIMKERNTSIELDSTTSALEYADSSLDLSVKSVLSPIVSDIESWYDNLATVIVELKDVNETLDLINEQRASITSKWFEHRTAMQSILSGEATNYDELVNAAKLAADELDELEIKTNHNFDKEALKAVAKKALKETLDLHLGGDSLSNYISDLVSKANHIFYNDDISDSRTFDIFKNKIRNLVFNNTKAFVKTKFLDALNVAYKEVGEEIKTILNDA